MSEKLSVSSVSISILEDMILQIIQDTVAESVLNEKVTREIYGTVSNPIYINSSNPLHPTTESNGHSYNGESLSALRKINRGNNLSGHSTHNNSQASSVGGTPQPDLPNNTDVGRFAFVQNGKDIYVNALNAAKTTNQSNGNSSNHNGPSNGSSNGSELYFKCSNCDRRIAGSRFAAHVDKCLGGRTRK